MGSIPAEGMFVRLVFVVCSARSWSLVRKSPTECVCLIACDLGTSIMKRPKTELHCYAADKIYETKSEEV